ncbi:hypothetical protein DNHGIG_40140 [Collibacillus ludicampi]|uniref:Lipoprotein n=1 Tax=Collibacillus ludicampi TaxID=2771369 RepID=A0AAV4LL48_9BACL|nr:hypothetical protein [Collibacillus ludicampi]GIM48465.1 hypothetical protein DNHGIG_40140 [Collibacillus ludicampi]
MMKAKNLITISLVLLFGLGQTGCSTSQQPTQDHSHEAGATHDHSDQSNAPTNTQKEKAIQDEFNGLAKIETDVNKGDFQSAEKLFEQLHEEFHSAILPAVKEKNATVYDDIHDKFDSLEEALHSQDKNKTISAIKTSRDSLNQAVKVLGISVKQ